MWVPILVVYFLSIYFLKEKLVPCVLYAKFSKRNSIFLIPSKAIWALLIYAVDELVVVFDCYVSCNHSAKYV